MMHLCDDVHSCCGAKNSNCLPHIRTKQNLCPMLIKVQKYLHLEHMKVLKSLLSWGGVILSPLSGSFSLVTVGYCQCLV